MSARKPLALHTGHKTKAEKRKRAESEQGLSPRVELSKSLPPELKGHSKAQAAWKYTMDIYNQLDAKIVTSLDLGILIDYCLLIEQLADLEKMRTDYMQSLRIVQDNFRKLSTKGADPKRIIAEQLGIADKITALMEWVHKIDQRADRKRTLIHTLRQSLYLTPRARSGVAPTGKEQEQEKSEIERLLDDE